MSFMHKKAPNSRTEAYPLSLFQSKASATVSPAPIMPTFSHISGWIWKILCSNHQNVFHMICIYWTFSKRNGILLVTQMTDTYVYYTYIRDMGWVGCGCAGVNGLFVKMQPTKSPQPVLLQQFYFGGAALYSSCVRVGAFFFILARNI